MWLYQNLKLATKYIKKIERQVIEGKKIFSIVYLKIFANEILEYRNNSYNSITKRQTIKNGQTIWRDNVSKKTPNKLLMSTGKLLNDMIYHWRMQIETTKRYH